MRKGIVIAWLTALLVAIGFLFWYNEWQYKLPTPVPENYVAVNKGERIILPQGVAARGNKPLFLHFFNPNCPCSRFNFKHFRSLVKNYGAQVDFAIVVMSSDEYTAPGIQQKYDIDIPVYFDSTIAAACGVYSTPQAVIIENNSSLFYRGNYNTSRYCADKKTEFARIALDALLENKSTITFDQLALTAYGCRLPKCNN
jgi:hypothetical protein